eukprot:CAMPEP_0116108372 /NCGR_PEP_ID=MMETSP0327-20121206/16750_1 /TAXON_ID=44447 /ORGANISM="Pseudo-nitzschia delicatissima, Strain B596" /LENGTH=36 /DNA_ID= /DNA_START= /DNA_END= /DNA_ORIENTATION=
MSAARPNTVVVLFKWWRSTSTPPLISVSVHDTAGSG